MNVIDAMLVENLSPFKTKDDISDCASLPLSLPSVCFEVIHLHTTLLYLNSRKNEMFLLYAMKIVGFNFH